jgi:hypothetical protein
MAVPAVPACIPASPLPVEENLLANGLLRHASKYHDVHAVLGAVHPFQKVVRIVRMGRQFVFVLDVGVDGN